TFGDGSSDSDKLLQDPMRICDAERPVNVPLRSNGTRYVLLDDRDEQSKYYRSPMDKKRQFNPHKISNSVALTRNAARTLCDPEEKAENHTIIKQPISSSQLQLLKLCHCKLRDIARKFWCIQSAGR